jgi:hypothetical protein
MCLPNQDNNAARAFFVVAVIASMTSGNLPAG